MAIEDQIDNLKKSGALKDAIRDEDAIRQYLSNARQYRDDAREASSPLGRFTLAYEALHALAMAVLNDRGVRTGGEGHRSIALQLCIVELTKDSIKGAAQAIVQIHGARNDLTYFKPIPPVSDALAKATMKLLDAALDRRGDCHPADGCGDLAGSPRRTTQSLTAVSRSLNTQADAISRMVAPRPSRRRRASA